MIQRPPQSGRPFNSKRGMDMKDEVREELSHALMCAAQNMRNASRDHRVIAARLSLANKLDTIREALAQQPESEPVGVTHEVNPPADVGITACYFEIDKVPPGTELFTRPQPFEGLPKEQGQNRYGLDMAYFRNLINRDLNSHSLDNYKPSELARVFARMAATADRDVLQESEFSGPQPTPQVPEDAIRRAINHVFYVTHYVGPIQVVRSMEDEVISLLADSSIANGEERDYEIEELKSAAREMFKADAEYRCGFYESDRWRAAYLRLQKMVGSQESTCVFDPESDTSPPSEGE